VDAATARHVSSNAGSPKFSHRHSLIAPRSSLAAREAEALVVAVLAVPCVGGVNTIGWSTDHGGSAKWSGTVIVAQSCIW